MSTIAMANEVEKALEDTRTAEVRPEHDPELSAFIEYFKQRYGRELVAVLFVGSCLSDLTKSEDSFRDFFIILDSYRNTGRHLTRNFHKILPPDLYHYALQMPGGKEVHCKYYLLSVDDLLKTTGPEAPDIYVLGRLSKRVACVYTRNHSARFLVSRALASATEQAVELAASIMGGPMTDKSLYKLALRISYMAERRLEDDRKIENHYTAGEAYYQRVYGKLVERLINRGALRRLRDGRLEPDPAYLDHSPKEVEDFLKKSRRRAKMRWPKMIITVDNWMDQLICKLERTHGITIDIPGWERPVILITGWRYYFRLKRQGKIR